MSVAINGRFVDNGATSSSSNVERDPRVILPGINAPLPAFKEIDASSLDMPIGAPFSIAESLDIYTPRSIHGVNNIDKSQLDAKAEIYFERLAQLVLRGMSQISKLDLKILESLQQIGELYLDLLNKNAEEMLKFTLEMSDFMLSQDAKIKAEMESQMRWSGIASIAAGGIEVAFGIGMIGLGLATIIPAIAASGLTLGALSPSVVFAIFDVIIGSSMVANGLVKMIGGGIAIAAPKKAQEDKMLRAVMQNGLLGIFGEHSTKATQVLGLSNFAIGSLPSVAINLVTCIRNPVRGVFGLISLANLFITGVGLGGSLIKDMDFDKKDMVKTKEQVDANKGISALDAMSMGGASLALWAVIRPTGLYEQLENALGEDFAAYGEMALYMGTSLGSNLLIGKLTFDAAKTAKSSIDPNFIQKKLEKLMANEEFTKSFERTMVQLSFSGIVSQISIEANNVILAGFTEKIMKIQGDSDMYEAFARLWRELRNSYNDEQLSRMEENTQKMHELTKTIQDFFKGATGTSELELDQFSK